VTDREGVPAVSMNMPVVTPSVQTLSKNSVGPIQVTVGMVWAGSNGNSSAIDDDDPPRLAILYLFLGRAGFGSVRVGFDSNVGF
jgi:hypothetical protein